MNMQSVDRGEYPLKPMFRSKTEKAVLLFMTSVDLLVVGYWLFYLTYNG